MFNLSKLAQEIPTSAVDSMHARGDLGDIGGQLEDRGRELTYENSSGEADPNFEPDDIQDEQLAEQAEKLVDIKTLSEAHHYLEQQGQAGRTAWWSLINNLAAQDVANGTHYRNVGQEIADSPQLQAVAPEAERQAIFNVENGPLGEQIAGLLNDARNRAQQGDPMQQMGSSTGSKTAQVQALETDIADKGVFVSKYIDELLAYEGDKGEGDTRSELAKNDIMMMVSPAAIEEANSPLEAIQGLSPQIDRDKAEQYLAYIFDNWIAPAAVGTEEVVEMPAAQPTEQPMQPMQPMQPVMSQKNPKGIIKYNLAVLNNSHTIVKTAADQFGQQYLLYGPTEKRICPKLRGKGGGQHGSGDVVSEYVCRHHCLEGIVIDDNKTICGEALWRSHAMDKFSREYVDAQGDLVGGYLNRRFEINRNVPEENKMRLQPGEPRKPRPPEWGSTESRMQAMRKAEGKKRDYRPDVNTGDPFQWGAGGDDDQNNVEQSQSTRDSREEASGHQTVQYTDKAKQESKPKLAKKAERDQLAVEIQKTHEDCGCKGKGKCSCGPDCSCGCNSKKSFNLAHVKQAQMDMTPITGPYNELQGINEQKEDTGLPAPEETNPAQIDKLKKIRDRAVRVNNVNGNGRKASFNIQRFAQGGNLGIDPRDGAGLKDHEGRLDPGPFEENCPKCGSSGTPMGSKKHRNHQRCHNCGFDYSTNMREKTTEMRYATGKSDKDQVRQTLQKAEDLAAKLKNKGWQQTDSADALKGSFDTDRPEDHSDEALRNKGKQKKASGFNYKSGSKKKSMLTEV